ncbi:MAG TPA: metal-binding protein [Pyrinomonadaceae bacterium]|nr:metal-binding protein [Pyrinomonadaceae bacterium]
MPSGNTHDAITFILTVPAAIITYYALSSPLAAAVGAAAFLFGGLMFGPDLDLVSKQYSRWRFFRFLWLPYRSFFKHRSRWTHGLLFGTLFRVVYLMGIVTVLLFAASYFSALIFKTEMPRIVDLAAGWTFAGRVARQHAGAELLFLVFFGMWSGAASHTFTDMAGSYIKTGRSGGFL